MIPQRLNIRNFLCYREDVPDLDFAGIHVACLCGDNGHGKSALLDSITWSLWGKARGRTQDELISYGADECRVEFEFTARESRYRVIRSHARGRTRSRAGVSDLQFQILDSGQAQSIPGNTIRETQHKIDQIIGMQYDTFINSAFLMQGRSDEFTSKTPGDRKDLLADILGLDIYDRLQRKARDHARLAESEVDRSRGALELVENQIVEIGDPSEELQPVEADLARIESEFLEKTTVSNAIRDKLNSMLAVKTEKSQLEDDIEKFTIESAQIHSQISTITQRIEDCTSIINRADEIVHGVRMLQEARTGFESLEQSRNQFESWQQEKTLLEQKVLHQESALTMQSEQIQKKIHQDLKPKAQSQVSLQAKSDQLKLESLNISKEKNDLELQKQHHQDLTLTIADLKKEAERQESEGKDIGAKLSMMESADNTHATCPLCLTELGTDGHQRVIDTYNSEILSRRTAYKDTVSSLNTVEVERQNLELEISHNESSISNTLQKLQIEETETSFKLDESLKSQEALESLEAELQIIEDSIKSKSFCRNDLDQLNLLDSKITSLNYDDATRQKEYLNIQNLQIFESEHVRLEQAKVQVSQDSELLSSSQISVGTREKDIAIRRSRLEQCVESLQDLPDQQGEFDKIANEISVLDNNRRSALSRKATLEGQLVRKSQLNDQIKSTRATLASAEQSQGIFRELATMFGKEGIQAMLIETVVPLIEEETNLLLGRMTDNRMHVKLETQKERRSGKGDPVETLEINVSDELGSRSYEMYSGGEAFRINLSIRIALSKVLAQRMGAPLPTLFIDEGFGTQDASSRERILDVISSIQDDFDKIIVITHLEDLKDMFPVRIEVHKSSAGSTFWLS